MIGGSWLAGVVGSSFIEGSFGAPKPPAHAVYDLASMTKVLCTSAILARDWLASGKTWAEFLAQPLVERLPEIRGTWFADRQLGEIWEHRSGAMANLDFGVPARRWPAPGEDRAELWRGFLARALAQKPGGERGHVIYSDVGLLLLGLWLERTHGKSIDELWARWKAERLLSPEVLEFGAHRSAEARAQAQPTETRHAVGEVNDDKAASLGGIAPHAGLFGSTLEVWRWLEVVSAWRQNEPRLGEWLTPATDYDQGPDRYHGGWDRPSHSVSSQAGYPAPPRTVGHTGWTGTAFWWHPPSGRAAILLTNRVHPAHSEASHAAVKKLRQRFFSDFWQGTLNQEWQPPRE